MKKITILLVALTMSGCASLSKPTMNSLKGVPVVEIGGGEQDAENYILHIPAHHEFPVTLNITGSLMDEDVSVATIVSIKKELWAYKEWISYDGITWQSDSAFPVIEMTAEIVVDSRGGTVVINTDLREE